MGFERKTFPVVVHLIMISSQYYREHIEYLVFHLIYYHKFYKSLTASSSILKTEKYFKEFSPYNKQIQYQVKYNY